MRDPPTQVALLPVVALVGCGGTDPKNYTCKDFDDGGGKDTALEKAVAKAAGSGTEAAANAIGFVCQNGLKAGDKPYAQAAASTGTGAGSVEPVKPSQ